MTIFLWLLGGLTVILVAVHMMRPYAARALISAARFFWPAAPPSANRRRWRWANPLRSRPLWLQLPAALLLLTALLLYNRTVASTTQTQALGVWLLLDTSASMSAKDSGGTRFDQAQLAVAKVVAAAAAASQGESLCFRLSTFDQELQHLLEDADAAAVLARSLTLHPRSLGTDLALVHNLIAQPADQQARCHVTHFVVISDLPAPQAAVISSPAANPTGASPLPQTALTSTLPLLWESVELNTANSGITAIDAEVDPLTRRVMGVSLQLTAYGAIPATQLEVKPPNGPAVTVTPDWKTAGPQERRWSYRLMEPASGVYEFRLATDDGIAFDNEAAIEIPVQDGLKVDWRVDSAELPNQLGWTLDAVAPALRVAASDMLPQLPADNSPLLLVGRGYGPPFAAAQIVEFADDRVLLDNVLFEQLERTGLSPFTTLSALPREFIPVLASGGDADALVWLAAREQPPAVYIPGLPAAPDLEDETWRLSALLFANATRWLLKGYTAPPLYTVTTTDKPEPAGTRNALHSQESNTILSAKAAADLSALSPRPAAEEDTPIWPWLVVASLAVIITERSLAAWRGGSWC